MRWHHGHSRDFIINTGIFAAGESWVEHVPRLMPGEVAPASGTWIYSRNIIAITAGEFEVKRPDGEIRRLVAGDGGHDYCQVGTIAFTALSNDAEWTCMVARDLSRHWARECVALNPGEHYEIEPSDARRCVYIATRGLRLGERDLSARKMLSVTPGSAHILTATERAVLVMMTDSEPASLTPQPGYGA